MDNAADLFEFTWDFRASEALCFGFVSCERIPWPDRIPIQINADSLSLSFSHEKSVKYHCKMILELPAHCSHPLSGKFAIWMFISKYPVQFLPLPIQRQQRANLEKPGRNVERAGNLRPVLEVAQPLSLIHISEPTRLLSISYAVFCLKKKINN